VATEQFANNAQSSLAAAVGAGDTSLTVANAIPFPATGNFRVIIDGEILLVTGVVGNTFTVTRGAEGTAAAAHAVGAYVTHVLTAAALLNCPRAMTAAGDLEYLAASGAVTRRAVGSAGQVLTVVSGLPAWQNAPAADMLAALVNAPNLITNADANLSAATWNVVKATAAAHTVTLPAPAAGVLVGVRVTGDSTKLVTLSQHAADLIDGQAARVMWAGEKAVLLSDGTNWFKVAGLTIPMVCTMRLGTATGYTVADSVATKVQLDTAEVDNTGLMADTANSRIVAQRPGKYAVNGLVLWNSLAADATIVATKVYQNGTTLFQTGAQASHVGFPAIPAMQSSVAVASGDYFELYGRQSSGANESFYGAAVGADSASFLSLVEVPQW
jgi:hypothetical protein